jgi:sulfite exporter TauE/SafE
LKKSAVICHILNRVTFPGIGERVSIIKKILPYIVAGILVAFIALLARDVVGLKGQIIIFVCIILGYIGLNMGIRRMQKKLKNQLYNLDTDLREDIKKELEKDGILDRKS